MYSYAEQLLIVDLSTGEVEVVDLDDALAEDVLGGVALGARLLEQHADGDPVVIATGPLTGTLVPGAAVAVMSRKAQDGSPVHVPLTQFLGAELKYAGFDAIVIKGEAADPALLWVHDGLADLEDASELWGADTWHAADTVKGAKGDEVVQLLSIGPAGEAGLEGAGVVGTYWATTDHAGFAAAFGRKKLKGVALRGLGIIDIEEPDELQALSLDMTDAAVEAGPPMGLAQLASGLGVTTDMGQWISPAVHRHKACFSCPAACMTYVKFDEPPDEMRSTDVGEPGFLLTDVAAAAQMKEGGFSPADAGRVLAEAAKLGVAPRVAARVARETGGTDADEAVNALTAALSARSLAAADDLGSQPPRSGTAGYVLGVCPTLMELTGTPDTAGLLDALAMATGLELEEEELNEVVGEAGPVTERAV